MKFTRVLSREPGTHTLGLDGAPDKLRATHRSEASELLGVLSATMANTNDVAAAWRAGAEQVGVALALAGGSMAELGKISLVAFNEVALTLSPGDANAPLAQLLSVVYSTFGDEIVFNRGASCITAFGSNTETLRGSNDVFAACDTHIKSAGLDAVVEDIYALLVMLLASERELREQLART